MAGSTPCGNEDLTPRRPHNRPGLAQISYRIGTQPEFLKRMEWGIPRQFVTDPESGVALKPLAVLRARDTSDPSLALMDAFAASLDVLSFYSERIANEAYIGTAVQRRSMIEIARMIGYKMAPGVAASVHLSFAVEDADDSYRAVDVPAGLQAMSVPQARDELPQVFETVEPIQAHAEWNAMPLRTEQAQNLALYRNAADGKDQRNGQLYLFDPDNRFDIDASSDPRLESFATVASLENYSPLSADLDLGAALHKLIDDHQDNPDIEPVLHAVPVDETYLRGTGLGLKPGNRILAVGIRADDDGGRHVDCSVLRVVTAVDDNAFGVTTLVSTRDGAPPDAVRRAPPYRAPRLPSLRMPVERVAFDAATVDSMVRNATWRGEALSALVRIQAWPRDKLMQLFRMPRPAVAGESSEARPGLYILRDDSGFFGCTAPLREMLAKAGESRGADPYVNSWDKPDPRTVWTGSQGEPQPGSVHVFLEREIKEIVAGGWAAMESPEGDVRVFRVKAAAAQARSDYAMNGKATGLTFVNPDDSDVVLPDPALDAFKFRTAKLHAVSEPLALAGTPIRADVAAGADSLDLASLYLDIERGQAVSISGERSDADGLVDSETLLVADVVHIGGYTQLQLEQGPEHSYARPSVRLNANMALATHGEFFEELLGSGDASIPNQLFTLAKKPLTFVSAATPNGRASTLVIRVDGIAWHEVGSLYDAGPHDRAYELRQEEDGVTRVAFGDGERGSRLPTGVMNVAAFYRTGIGFAGEVRDEAIIQLKTKPLGIRGVANPSPASGSAEPASIDTARSQAPASVRTLGRIVSITDYEDHATSFAGLGKARADAVWSGRERVAYLTVTPESGGLLDAGAPVLASLKKAVDQIRDGTDAVVIAPYERRYFQLSARLFKHPDHLVETVAAAAREALLSAFGYAARSLAQPVSAAETIAVLQRVPGVVGVDLDILTLLDGGSPDPAAKTLESVLPAMTARLLPPEQGGGLAPAQLLTILESAIDIAVEDAHA